MLDLFERIKKGSGCEVIYIWFDTGIEYKATKDHLRYLEDRYGIEIIRYKAEKSIPLCAKQFGQPFLSKYVSQNISQLQRHGFHWEDEPLSALVERYPNCLTALKWWTNSWTRTERPGWYDIGRNHLLKEFMVENPPTFHISDKCCKYAKKKVAKAAYQVLKPDVTVIGVREDEGGTRQINKTLRDSCLTIRGDRWDEYRPIYWWKTPDKEEYRKLFGVVNSDCYEVWGFTRTGCVGCPFGRTVFSDLEVARRYEPRMVRAVENIFADAYEYTRMYNDYKAREKSQMTIDLRHAR